MYYADNEQNRETCLTRINTVLNRATTGSLPMSVSIFTTGSIINTGSGSILNPNIADRDGLQSTMVVQPQPMLQPLAPVLQPPSPVPQPSLPLSQPPSPVPQPPQPVPQPMPQRNHDHQFHSTFTSFKHDLKWRLPSGSTVEDILFQQYYMAGVPEEVRRSIRHWTVLVDNDDMRRMFLPQDWLAILAQVKALPRLGDPILNFLSQFHAVCI